MKKLQKMLAIIEQSQWKKIAIAFLISIVLLSTTACNSGDELGARPEVSPVQMGGQNNPHKAGGDGMGQYKSPANNSNLSKDRASLPANFYLAAANNSNTSYPTDDNKVEGLLYSNGDRAKSLDSTDDFVSPQTQRKLLDPTQIPAEKQPAIDRSDSNNQLLEKAGQMFDDASNFSGN